MRWTKEYLKEPVTVMRWQRWAFIAFVWTSFINLLVSVAKWIIEAITG